MRFRHAGDIGAGIAQQRFGQIAVLARHERPELVAFRQRNAPVMPGAATLLTAAEIEFRLADGRQGSMTLVTSGSDVPGLGGTWGVDDLYGFVAPPEAVGVAGAALGRLLGAFRVNPQWVAAELRGQRIDGERYLAYLHQSAALQQRTLEQRWAAQDRVAAARGDLLSGTVRLVDPRTGEVFQARAGSRYFYRALPDGSRPSIVGVDVDANPEPRIEMRRMLQMGVDIPYR